MRWLVASLLLSGCAAQQVVLPKEVRVPVPIPCLERLPDAPAVTSDADLLAAGDYELVILIAKDRAAVLAAYGELRAAAQACVK